LYPWLSKFINGNLPLCSWAMLYVSKAGDRGYLECEFLVSVLSEDLRGKYNSEFL